MDCGVSCPLPILKIFYLRTIQNILMTCCQVSDRRPLGYLFLILFIIFPDFNKKHKKWVVCPEYIMKKDLFGTVI